MPSSLPLPTVSDFLTAGQEAVRGQVDIYADLRTGSIYDHINGPLAILHARQAQADRDKFRAIYINTAQGADLTRIVTSRLGVPRILAAQGQGLCQFSRSNASGGATTFWAGTRIQVNGNNPVIYQVANTVSVGSVTGASIPIQAALTGPGSQVSAATNLTLLDALSDTTWAPTSLTCAAGTNFEDAQDYVARARATLLTNRNGYLAKITSVLAGIGAAHIIAFDSTYGLNLTDFSFNDSGLNAIYVGDANFGSTPALVQAATIALESCRVLGCDLWVGGIQKQLLQITGIANLIDDPGKLPQTVIQQSILQALTAEFPAYVVKTAAISATICSASPYIQSYSGFLPPVDSTIAPGNFPATLLLYTVTPGLISVTLGPPV